MHPHSAEKAADIFRGIVTVTGFHHRDQGDDCVELFLHSGRTQTDQGCRRTINQERRIDHVQKRLSLSAFSRWLTL
jgi:hypothetical protein